MTLGMQPVERAINETHSFYDLHGVVEWRVEYVREKRGIKVETPGGSTSRLRFAIRDSIVLFLADDRRRCQGGIVEAADFNEVTSHAFSCNRRASDGLNCNIMLSPMVFAAVAAIRISSLLLLFLSRAFS